MLFKKKKKFIFGLFVAVPPFLFIILFSSALPDISNNFFYLKCQKLTLITKL